MFKSKINVVIGLLLFPVLIFAADTCSVSVPTVDQKLDIQIPSIEYTPVVGESLDLWASFSYYGVTSDGRQLWVLNGYGENESVDGPECTSMTISFSGENLYLMDNNENNICSGTVSTENSPYWPENSYVIKDAQLGDVDGDGRCEIVVIAHHTYWYPGQVSVFDEACSLQGRYWNPGFVYSMELQDITGDGVEEIVVGATNNDYKGNPSVFALYGSSVSGEAPPEYGDFPAGSHMWYTQLNGRGGIKAINVADGVIHGNAAEDWSGTDYCLNFAGSVVSCNN